MEIDKKNKKRKIKIQNKNLTVITHNGKFHADDVFAVATMNLVLREKFRLIRTRDKDLMLKGDIVIDVGGIYNSKKNRFDHHQPEGAGKRSNGIPYSSLGLVWKKFGNRACGNKKISDYLDKNFVQQIDAVDNGFQIAKHIIDAPIYDISKLIEAFVPAWDEKKDADRAFREAVEIAKQILLREIIKARSKFKAEKYVKAAYQRSKDKRIIVLSRYYPSQELVVNFPETKFVIYPQNGSWHARAVRVNLLDFRIRTPFPSLWSGRRNEDLVRVSGVGDAVFCHRNLFLALAKTKEGAIKLAQKAIYSKQ